MAGKITRDGNYDEKEYSVKTGTGKCESDGLNFFFSESMIHKMFINIWNDFSV